MIPDRLLRDLTLQTRTTSTDRYGDLVTTGWTDTLIRGRIEQFVRREVTDSGRDASVTEWRLFTNTDAITAASRIQNAAPPPDGDYPADYDPDYDIGLPPDAATLTFEVDGRPAPVYAATTIHHYEASLTLVEG